MCGVTHVFSTIADAATGGLLSLGKSAIQQLPTALATPPAPTAPPGMPQQTSQAAQRPQASAGGSPGSAGSTLLTGGQGIAPSLLTLGKNVLLGQ